MAIGPVELLVVKFPGNQFKGEIIPELTALVESGTIRVLDIVIVTKDGEGNVAMVEVQDLDLDDTVFDPAIADLTELLTEEDVAHFGAMLEPNSSEAVMLFENTWATRLATALRNANAEVVLNERIPRSVIEELVASAVAD
ncbi:MAG: DUF6325 family protein [Dehalococcoidia bacterium]